MRTKVGIVITVFLFCRCTGGDEYAEKARTLDSLGGAINGVISNLQRTDTVALIKALSCFRNYKTFVDQKLGDTLNKKEAEHLLLFYENGKRLESYQVNRLNLLARARLACSQIQKLGNDARSAAISREALAK